MELTANTASEGAPNTQDPRRSVLAAGVAAVLIALVAVVTSVAAAAGFWLAAPVALVGVGLALRATPELTGQLMTGC